MTKLRSYLMVTALIYSGLTVAVDTGPLLISELPPGQVYSESELAAFEKGVDLKLKGRESSGLEKDYQTYSAVLSINPEKVTPEQKDYLLKLTEHKSLAYKAHPEGPVAVPVFNIRALAEYKIFQYEVAAQAEKMKELIANDHQLFVKESLNNKAQLQAARKALNDSLPISDAVLNNMVMSYKANNSSSSAMLLSELVQLTGNKQAVYALLDFEGEHWQKSQILNNLSQYLTAQEQEAVLHNLIHQKGELSSQAVLHYARLPATVSKPDLLYGLLSDQYLGASSAAALARSAQKPLDVRWLKHNIQRHSESRVTVANSLLALKLAGDVESKYILRELLESDEIKFDDMKAEVLAWLK
ncbi:hypothetical protein [Kangiella sediminilitoris]|uniref:Uncharacterized protein n=1 Tax=Kangiella sediminilitoris TaxID=1144748 RepID=A0A1B3B9H7_9GAMM|nr:hypothetical protein [Kangiella sediminilitoris]AOE49435.1 hypothetical protein KS2013_711 [Kangiella sediminilitoris]